MQGIATSPVDAGGLGLFGEMTLEHKNIFKSLPDGIVEGRPESDMRFLAFLRGKEHVLQHVCEHDMTQRDLAEGTQDAIRMLGDLAGRVKRSIAAEVLAARRGCTSVAAV